MINVYNLFNEELINAFKHKDMNLVKEISSNSIFLIPVKDKNNINKIAFESMMDSKKDLYLPLFINMKNVEQNKMIKGKQILIAHFGMVETILNNHPQLKGIVINPCSMDCKLDRQESLDICKLYHKNENKLTFEADFYQPEKTTMADLKPKTLTPRSEVVVKVVNYLNTTTIKSAYVTLKTIGDKLHYNFIIPYNTRNEQSFIDELMYILEKEMQEKETFEISNGKQGISAKTIKFLKPIYVKKK